MAHDQYHWKSTLGNNFEIGKFYDGNERTECEELKSVGSRGDYSIVSTNALDLFSLNNTSKMDFHAGKLKHSSKASSCLEKYAYSPSESCLFFRYVRIRTPHRKIEKERLTATIQSCRHSTQICGRSHLSHIASRVLCGVEFVVVFSGPNVTSEKQVKLLKKFAGFIASLNRDESEFKLTLEYNQWDYYGDSPCPWPDNLKPSLQDIHQFCCKLANLDDEKFESLLNEPKNQKFVYLVPAQKQLALPYEVSSDLTSKTQAYYEKISAIRNRLLELKKKNIYSQCIEKKLKTLDDTIDELKKSFQTWLTYNLPFSSVADEVDLLKGLESASTPFQFALLNLFLQETEEDICLVNMCHEKIKDIKNISFCAECDLKESDVDSSSLCLKVYFLQLSKGADILQKISGKQTKSFDDRAANLANKHTTKEILQRNLKKLCDTATKKKDQKFKICEVEQEIFLSSKVRLVRFDHNNNASEDVTVSLYAQTSFWSPTFGEEFHLGLYDLKDMKCLKCNESGIKPYSAGIGPSYSISTNIFDALGLNNWSKLRCIGEKISPKDSSAYKCLKTMFYRPLETYIIFRYVFIGHGEQIKSMQFMEDLKSSNLPFNFAAIADKIMHGLEAVFVFTGDNITSENQEKNLNQFADAIKTSHNPLDSDDFDFSFSECMYYGDVPFSTSITKLSEIHRICISLSSIVDDGQFFPKSIHLAPICNIYEASDTIVSDCHTLLIGFSQVKNQLSKLEEESSCVASHFSIIKKKIIEFRECFVQYTDYFQQKLSFQLPFTSAEDECTLQTIIEQHRSSPFWKDTLNNWLQETEKEIKFAKICIENSQKFKTKELFWNTGSNEGSSDLTDNCLRLVINFVTTSDQCDQLIAMKKEFAHGSNISPVYKVKLNDNNVEANINQVFEMFHDKASNIKSAELEDWSFQFCLSSDSAQHLPPIELHECTNKQTEVKDLTPAIVPQEMDDRNFTNASVEILKATHCEIEFEVLEAFLAAGEIFRVTYVSTLSDDGFITTSPDFSDVHFKRKQNSHDVLKSEEKVIKLHKLQSFTEYSISVTKESNNATKGKFIAHVTCTTAFPPPKDLTLIQSQTCSISIDWNAPNSLIEDHINMNKEKYTVLYWEESHDPNSEGNQILVEDASCELSELSPYTKYNIEVQTLRCARSQDDYHENGKVEQIFSTLCPIPSSVTLRLKPISHSCMSLSWDKPNENFNFVDGYKILCIQSNSKQSSETVSKYVDHAETSFKFKNLLSDTEYKFSISVVSKDGKKHAGIQQFARTNDPIPSAPGKPTVERISHDKVNLSFSKPDKNSCYVSQYEIEKEGFFNGTVRDHEILKSSNSVNKFEVSDLQPKFTYVFKVRGCSTGGKGEHSKESDAIKIFEKFQPGQPKAVQTYYDRIEIVWDKPYCHKEVTNYTVMYAIDPKQEWTTVKSADCIKENNYIVRELSPETKYFFKVISVTADETKCTSEISDPIITTSAIPSAPGKPNCIDNERDHITIIWQKPQKNPDTVTNYKIVYYDEGNEDESIAAETGKCVEKLTVTKSPHFKGYLFKVIAVSKYGNSEESPRSDCIKADQRLIIDLILKCNKISENPTTYQLPAEISYTDEENQIQMQVHPPKSNQQHFSHIRQNDIGKVLLIVGATGAGKTTLINAIVNYLLGVEWNDNFRLKLIDEKSKSRTESATNMITSYTLNLVGSTITIVDTPGFGDTAGIERDEFIQKQMKVFFSKTNVGHLNAVVFVAKTGEFRLTPAQKHIFNAIFALFGKDIQQILHVFSTFSDGSKPAITEAMNKEGIRCESVFTVNNIGLYIQENEKNEMKKMFWTSNIDTFERFFLLFRKAQPVSLSQTQKVIHNRDHIRILTNNIVTLMEKKLNHSEQLKSQKEHILEHSDEIEQNSNFEFEYVNQVHGKEDNKPEEFTTNCNDCKKSCHYPCEIDRDINRYQCKAMEKRGFLTTNCVVCHCDWRKHRNDPYHYALIEERVTKTVDLIKKQYDIALEKKTSAEAIAQAIQNEIDGIDKEIEVDKNSLLEMNKNVQKIALKQNTCDDIDYIEMLIQVEKRSGNIDNVKTLNRLKERAITMKSVLNSGKNDDQS